MTALRILANCLASGQPLEAGRVYRVPADISQADAEVLLRMGRAIEAKLTQTPTPAPAPKRSRRAKP
jgi:hypothetical protein